MADATFAAAQEPARSPYRDTAMLLLGQAHLLAGHLDEARAVFAEASAIAANGQLRHDHPAPKPSSPGSPWTAASWQEAASHVELALATIEENRMHDYVCSIPAFAAAARLSLHDGDLKETHRQLARAMRSRPTATYLMPYHAVRLRLQLARVYFAIADAATARQLLREIDDILLHRPALGTLR